MRRRPPRSTLTDPLVPYTTRFRSPVARAECDITHAHVAQLGDPEPRVMEGGQDGVVAEVTRLLRATEYPVNRSWLQGLGRLLGHGHVTGALCRQIGRAHV